MAAKRGKSDMPDTALARNRRRNPRAIVEVSAQVRSSHGDETAMTIANISVHGCYISGTAPWLRLGGFVTVSLASGEAMTAIVRWVRGESAGLEFLREVPAGHGTWHDLIDSIADM
jgi:hypothetical protein